MSESTISATELMALMTKEKHENYLEDSLNEHIKKIQKTAEDSKPLNKSSMVKDSYGNSLLDIGNSSNEERFTNYRFDNDTLNWMLWLSLYNDSWVFKRAIDKPAQDEIRCGITLSGSSDYTDIYRKLKHYNFDLIQLLQWGALFGGSIACMMFDNVKDKDYKRPMNADVIKSAKSMKMYVVDRWYGVAASTETVTDMTNIDFGKPAYYDVTMSDGNTIRFHHDYVIRYEHRIAPKFIKNGMLQGWGYAEGSHIINELLRDDKLKSSVQSLVDKSLIEVIKMSGMRGVFMGADSDNEMQLRKRLEMVNWGRNFNSLTFLDKDDDYQQNQFSGLSGLSDLLEKNMWLISSALEMQGILFGDLKNGFSSDTDALIRYSETINQRCESYVRIVYEKLLNVLFMMEGITDKIEFDFNELSQKTKQDEFTDGLAKVAELLSKMLSDGAIDVKHYAKAIQKYATKGVLDLGLDDEYINSLDDKINEEMENIDIDGDAND